MNFKPQKLNTSSKEKLFNVKVKLSNSVILALKNMAHENNKTVNAFVNFILHEYLAGRLVVR